MTSISPRGGAPRAAAAFLALAVGLVLGALAAPQAALADDTVHVYRLLNPNDGQHLITADENEYRVLQLGGWQGEGCAFDARTRGGVAVYRLYNPYNGDHFYTADENEYRVQQRNGWRGEGPKFYGVSRSEGTPVYRLWNRAQTGNGGCGSHVWTADANEYASLPRINGAWRQEEAAWYGLAVKPLPANPSYVDGTDGHTFALYGTLVREIWTSDMMFGGAGAIYVLRLDRPIRVDYVPLRGGDGKATVSKLQIGANIKHYDLWTDGSNVNDGIEKLFVPELQPYAGFRVKVTCGDIHFGGGSAMETVKRLSIERVD